VPEAPARLTYITIAKGDVEAKIIPSSLKAWERNGWKAVDKAAPVAPAPKPATPPAPPAPPKAD